MNPDKVSLARRDVNLREIMQLLSQPASECEANDGPPSLMLKITTHRATIVRGLVSADSFYVDDVVEPVKPLGEPARQAVLWYGVLELRRGVQSTRGLTPRQCPA